MLSPKEVVNKWVDAFNDGDVDMIISLYDNIKFTTNKKLETLRKHIREQ